MAAANYIVGQSARITALFTDFNGAPADPSTISVKIKDPAGTETVHVYGSDVNVVKDAVGTYHYVLPLTLAGAYYARWVGSGTVVAASEELLRVLPSAFVTP